MLEVLAYVLIVPGPLGGFNSVRYETVWWPELSLAALEGPKEKPAKDFRNQPNAPKAWVRLVDVVAVKTTHRYKILAAIAAGHKEISL